MRCHSFTDFIRKLEHARLSHCSSTYTIFMCHIRCEPPPLSLYRFLQNYSQKNKQHTENQCSGTWQLAYLVAEIRNERKNPHRKMLSVQIYIDHFRGSFYGRCDNFFLPHSYTHTIGFSPPWHILRVYKIAIHIVCASTNDVKKS